MCRVYVGGRALGVLDGGFVSELVSKTFLGLGRLFCENQPAGHRTVSFLAQLLLVTRGQKTPRAACVINVIVCFCLATPRDPHARLLSQGSKMLGCTSGT